MYKKVTTLAAGIQASVGLYDLQPDDIQCTGTVCTEFEIGLLEVVLQDGTLPQAYKYKHKNRCYKKRNIGLSSKKHPINSFVKEAISCGMCK